MSTACARAHVRLAARAGERARSPEVRTLSARQLKCIQHGGYVEAERFDAAAFHLSPAEVSFRYDGLTKLLGMGLDFWWFDCHWKRAFAQSDAKRMAIFPGYRCCSGSFSGPS